MTEQQQQKRQKFLEKYKKLLEIEKQSEVEEIENTLKTLSTKVLSDRGLALPRMQVVEQCTGLYGKNLITLQSVKPDTPLKKGNRFQPGDIIGFKNDKENEIVCNGVVYKINEKSIQIALSKSSESATNNEEFEKDVYTIVKLANDITYKRMDRALEKISSFDDHLLNLLFEQTEPYSTKIESFQPINQGLNESQKEAISFALGSNDIALIHGPPGTGKTTTVVEFIAQAVKKGKKILACAPSNIAVDNMAEKLLGMKDSNIKLVRLGHPARFLPTVINRCLDNVVSSSNAAEVVKGMREDMDKIHKNIKLVRGLEKEKLWKEWRDTKRELKVRETKAVQDSLKSCNIVMSTCSGAGDRSLEKQELFDIVVIDEAGQGLEAVCWIPILKGKKVVLAGDHLQLPPTIHSDKAAESGLSITLFERLIKSPIIGPKASKMLVLQYRMNEKIMKWSSDALYESKLIAHSSVANHLLCDLPGVTKNENTTSSLVVIDTVGCYLYEEEDDEGSKSNEGEAQLVLKYLQELQSAKITDEKLSIISPYYAQVKLIRNMLKTQFPGVEVNTVDGFQGREKEVIIISMVRSNKEHVVGFLKENRRMNVAVTRAKRQCCLICDSETVSSDPFLQNLLDYFTENGEYLSAMQYLNIDKPVKAQPQTFPKKIENLVQEKKKVETEEDNLKKKREQDLLDKINEFSLNKDEQKLSFPNALSQAHIDFVENIAKKLDYYFEMEHRKNNQRFVHLYKAKPEVEVPVIEKKEKKPTNNQNKETKVEIQPKPIQKKEQPQQLPKEKPKVTKPKSPPPPKETKPNPEKNFQQKVNQLSEDEVLDYAAKLNDTCFYPKCKEGLKYLLRVCEYCKHKYCINHMQPLIHGCEEEHRKELRQQHKESFSQTTPTKPLRPGQRLYLQNKLQSRIEESASSRSKKTKDGRGDNKRGRGRG